MGLLARVRKLIPTLTISDVSLTLYWSFYYGARFPEIPFFLWSQSMSKKFRESLAYFPAQRGVNFSSVTCRRRGQNLK